MLVRRVPDLQAIRPPTIGNFEPYMAEAFGIVQRQLLQDGKRPYLAMNDYAFADWTVALTLGLIFRSFCTYTGEGRFATEAERYEAEAVRAFDRLKLEYDVVEANQRAAAAPAISALPVLYTNFSPGVRSEERRVGKECRL